MESFTAIEKINSTQNLSIKDFENGNIKYSDVMEEINYLKEQIPIVRQDMASFLIGLARIDNDSKPQQVYDENIQRVTSLQKTLDDYIERYKKLLPLIEVVNKAMKIKPLDKRPSTVTIPKPAKAITTNTTKKAAPRKRQYNKKGSSSTNTPIPDELQSISETRNTGNQNTRPGAESHPIVI